LELDEKFKDVIFKTIVVNPNGGGDYTKLSDAFSSITDSSFKKRYKVIFVGDGTEYNLLNDVPYVSGQIGLRVPPFTQLIGQGGPEKCILARRLSQADVQDSVINLYCTSGLEGFTLIGNNTRYVVHDDYFDVPLNNIDYEKIIKDCVFIGESLVIGTIYGAGIRSGAKWRFENCVFKSVSGYTNASYTCHNNTNFIVPSIQKFINCRFLSQSQYLGVSFGSLNNNANGIVNNVLFYGNKINQLTLKEENAQSYGSGILFKVSGYANDLKTGNENIHIINTDEHDYSDRIDLI
jgi:hypothetical protein